MTTMQTSYFSRFGLEYCPSWMELRVGRRMLSISRDFRKRYDNVSPVISCGVGIDRGHLEVLLFGRWILVLSKAH